MIEHTLIDHDFCEKDLDFTIIPSGINDKIYEVDTGI